MRTAIYTRVSTEKQSHDSQLTELRDYCQRRGWTDATEYREVISGARFTRAGLDKLMADVRWGWLDRVVCFMLDRLGRSLPHLAQIVAELTAHRVALICTSQGIDTSDENPAGKLQLGVLMAVAEFGREMIRERVNAGLRAARARGVKLGRPPSSRAHIDDVRRLTAEGKSIRATARELGLPVASVHKLVQRFSKSEPSEKLDYKD